MPQWGRPSGAKGSRRQRRWEQEQAMWEQQARVEELDSDDSDTQGVDLISEEKRFAGDPLQFTGMDLAAKNRARRGYNYDSEDSSEPSEESEAEGTNGQQLALRDKEEALVQSALARIRRAQEKGKSEVKLNQDELNALEKRRQRMHSAAAKARKGSGSDRGSGSERRRPEQVRMSIPLAAIEEPVRKKGRSRRSEGGESTPPPGVNPPGFLVAGPDGMTYAPVSYYPPQVTSKRSSPTRPRSATSAQLRGTPPAHFPYPAPGNPRHFQDNARPASSSSNSSRRPLPDEASWMPAHSRRSSVSSQSHGIDPFEYQVASEAPSPNPQAYLQSQPGRRYFSGPSEVSYSNIRRTPLSMASYAPQTSSSDHRRRSGRGEGASADSSSEEEEDQSDDLGNGVQVFVEEEPEREKERERPVVTRKPVSSGSNRQRRGKRS